jgi:hypothetical protein
MRHATAATLAAAALLTLTSCAAQTTQATTAREPHITARETVTSATSTQASTDLIMPGATTAQAGAAIRDYARRIHGPELYYIKVMHSRDATRYVCRARWYADPDAYRTHARTQDAWPDAWPHLAINCP